MRKSLLVTLVILLGAAAAWPAAAQDCQYHNLKLDLRDQTFLDDPGEYDFCAEVKLIGTLNGLYGYCGNIADFRSSHSIYGDNWTQIETAKYDSWIETKKGTLEMREWSWYDAEFFAETGFAKVIDGTGGFEDATGLLLWYPRTPGTGAFLPFEGYICGPED